MEDEFSQREKRQQVDINSLVTENAITWENSIKSWI